jgi:murein DD-endopeptidase MepM/ murein hydrolase activator NlpD
VSSSVLAGETVQLAAVTTDVDGNVLDDRLVTWTSSDETVASVSTTGLVTTVAPGTVTVTATSEARSATATIEVVDPAAIPAFQRPFAVDFEVRTTNYHDHDEPREFVDDNGIYVPYWGEPSLMGIDGHEGYDWRLPVGTPLLAVADGEVVAATLTGTPFFCPILNATVSGNSRVVLEHALPGGVRVRSVYVHVEQIDVQVGQTVRAGDVIALSGARGCALNPHLHFAVFRMTQTNSGSASPIDPYGWEGPTTDPWTLSPDGAASIRLWKPGEAPTLFRFVTTPLGETAGPFVQITQVRFQGVRDDQNPNNEYVEVTRDARVAPAQLDISGFTLTTRAGLVFTFPAGTVLSDALPSARVYVGSGTDGPGVLHWGRSAGALDNLAECVRFRNTAGALRNAAQWGGGCSP